MMSRKDDLLEDALSDPFFSNLCREEKKPQKPIQQGNKVIKPRPKKKQKTVKIAVIRYLLHRGDMPRKMVKRPTGSIYHAIEWYDREWKCLTREIETPLRRYKIFVPCINSDTTSIGSIVSDSIFAWWLVGFPGADSGSLLDGVRFSDSLELLIHDFKKNGCDTETHEPQNPARPIYHYTSPLYRHYRPAYYFTTLRINLKDKSYGVTNYFSLCTHKKLFHDCNDVRHCQVKWKLDILKSFKGKEYDTNGRKSVYGRPIGCNDDPFWAPTLTRSEFRISEELFEDLRNFITYS